MKYSGELIKPIARRELGVLASNEQREQESKEITEIKIRKMMLLADAYGIAPGNWLGLCIALADVHVPGFKVVPKAGRKTVWGMVDIAELKRDVDGLIAKSKCSSVLSALEEIKRTEYWREKTRRMDVNALRKYYYSADPRMVQLLHEADCYAEFVRNEQSAT